MKEIDLDTITDKKFDVEDLMEWLSSETKVLMWAAQNYCAYKEHVLRFKVHGLNHKGYVYISGSAKDVFNVYFTTIEDIIVSWKLNVNILDLINTIDKRVQ